MSKELIKALKRFTATLKAWNNHIACNGLTAKKEIKYAHNHYYLIDYTIPVAWGRIQEVSNFGLYRYYDYAVTGFQDFGEGNKFHSLCGCPSIHEGWVTKAVDLGDLVRDDYSNNRFRDIQ